jgi:hypothetical protein
MSKIFRQKMATLLEYKKYRYLLLFAAGCLEIVGLSQVPKPVYVSMFIGLLGIALSVFHLVIARSRKEIIANVAMAFLILPIAIFCLVSPLLIFEIFTSKNHEGLYRHLQILGESVLTIFQMNLLYSIPFCVIAFSLRFLTRKFKIVK